MIGLSLRSMLISVSMAGIVVGMLSSVGGILLVNCCCGAWIWSGGIGSVWLYRLQEIGKNNGVLPTVNSIQGALLGALTGVLGGVVAFALSILINLVSSPESSLLIGPAIGPQTMAWMIVNEYVLGSDWDYAEMALGFGYIVLIVGNPTVGALGGLIGSMVNFKPKAATPPPAV